MNWTDMRRSTGFGSMCATVTGNVISRGQVPFDQRFLPPVSWEWRRVALALLPPTINISEEKKSDRR